MDLTTLRLPFKERQSCNLNVMSPVPTTMAVVRSLKVLFVQKFDLGYCHYFATIEYFRLNIEYLRYPIDLKRRSKATSTNLQFTIPDWVICYWLIELFLLKIRNPQSEFRNLF